MSVQKPWVDKPITALEVWQAERLLVRTDLLYRFLYSGAMESDALHLLVKETEAELAKDMENEQEKV